MAEASSRFIDVFPPEKSDARVGGVNVNFGNVRKEIVSVNIGSY